MEDCMRTGVQWGIFMTWNELTFTQNSLNHIQQVYASPLVKKLNKSAQSRQQGNLRREGDE